MIGRLCLQAFSGNSFQLQGTCVARAQRRRTRFLRATGSYSCGAAATLVYKAPYEYQVCCFSFPVLGSEYPCKLGGLRAKEPHEIIQPDQQRSMDSLIQLQVGAEERLITRWCGVAQPKKT